MEDFYKFKYWQYINKNINDLNENEKEFINLELDFKYTNLFRINQLIQFLKDCRRFGKEFKPTLLFIRQEGEKLESIHKNSLKLIEMNFHVIDEKDYWKRMEECGI